MATTHLSIHAIHLLGIKKWWKKKIQIDDIIYIPLLFISFDVSDSFGLSSHHTKWTWTWYYIHCCCILYCYCLNLVMVWCCWCNAAFFFLMYFILLLLIHVNIIESLKFIVTSDKIVFIMFNRINVHQVICACSVCVCHITVSSFLLLSAAKFENTVLTEY